MADASKKDELDPTTSPTDDDVEGHGIEEDDADEVAEQLTICGICIEPD